MVKMGNFILSTLKHYDDDKPKPSKPLCVTSLSGATAKTVTMVCSHVQQVYKPSSIGSAGFPVVSEALECCTKYILHVTSAIIKNKDFEVRHSIGTFRAQALPLTVKCQEMYKTSLNLISSPKDWK